MLPYQSLRCMLMFFPCRQDPTDPQEFTENQNMGYEMLAGFSPLEMFDSIIWGELCTNIFVNKY
jgi:hypothetical protein